MDQENKNTTGAPSNDTTSALFVSARKKQLEQQEADRRAKEKEDQRLAAEAEVRRLEREVEERRRKAEEDAKHADEDARRIAEEARAKQAQAATNPDAVLGAQPPKKEHKLPKMPQFSMPSKAERPARATNGGAGAAAKAPLNTKMIAIIGGSIAAVILIIVLVTALGGGGSSALENSYRSNSLGLEFMYPTGWEVEEDANLNAVTLNQGDAGMLSIIDATENIYNFGDDVISATEAMMQMIIETFGLDPADMPPPSLTKTGDFVSGSVAFESGEIFVKLQAEVIEERLIFFVYAVTLDERESFEEIASEIEFSLAIDPPGGAVEKAVGETPGYDLTGTYYTYMDEEATGAYLVIYADGTAEITSPDGSKSTGEWVVEDTNILNITGTAEPMSLMISDENTLYLGADYIMYKSGTQPGEAPDVGGQERVIEANAPADASVEFEPLHMYVYYPSSVFEVSDQTGQLLFLEDIYGDGALFSVMVLLDDAARGNKLFVNHGSADDYIIVARKVTVKDPGT